MNTLRDTLIDFANDVLDKIKKYRCNDNQIAGTTESEVINETVEEYIERIKNELDFEKYLQ